MFHRKSFSPKSFIDVAWRMSQAGQGIEPGALVTMPGNAPVHKRRKRRRNDAEVLLFVMH